MKTITQQMIKDILEDRRINGLTFRELSIKYTIDLSVIILICTDTNYNEKI